MEYVLYRFAIEAYMEEDQSVFNEKKKEIEEEIEFLSAIQLDQSNDIEDWKEIVPLNHVFEGIHGHTTIKYQGGLWLLGGARHGWALNQLSHFDLVTHRWRVVQPKVLDSNGNVDLNGSLPVISDHGAILFQDKMIVFGTVVVSCHG